MNPYVSADEKAHLIRIILMINVLADAIEIYAGLNSTDKSFLAELRHGRTRVEKAIKLRRLALNNDDDNKLIASAAKLHPMFLATPEAKKAHKELLELQKVLPMELDDLQDWYGFAIDFTCKNCIKSDYEECPARRVLSKYEICPIDPGAKDKCQYSYFGTPEAEELQPIDADKTIPAIVYNAALAMVRAKEDSIMENYVPAINQLDKELSAAEEQIESLQEKNASYIERNQELYAEIRDYEKFKSEIVDVLYLDSDNLDNLNECDIVTAVREMNAEYDVINAENIKIKTAYNALAEKIAETCCSEECNDEDIVREDDSLPVFLGLNNGNKLEMLLPERMVKKLIEDIQRPRLARSICAQYVAGEFVAIDLQEVVALNVSGLVDADYVKPQANVPANSFTTEQELYHVECKCGTEYFATMNAGRTKANCRDCKYTVFADRSAERVISPTDGIGAVLLTNRYFVTNEPSIPQQSADDRGPVRSNNLSNSRELKPVVELRDIKNIGREYKDPCRLFG